MNTIQLIGRLTRDPEARSLPSGKSVANMRLAVPRRDREAAPVYIDVVAFDQLAALCAKHLAKGRQIAVGGRLEYSEWEAQDGSKRSRHDVIANDVEFLSKAKAQEATASEQDEDIVAAAQRIESLAPTRAGLFARSRTAVASGRKGYRGSVVDRTRLSDPEIRLGGVRVTIGAIVAPLAFAEGLFPEACGERSDRAQTRWRSAYNWNWNAALAAFKTCSALTSDFPGYRHPPRDADRPRWRKSSRDCHPRKSIHSHPPCWSRVLAGGQPLLRPANRHCAGRCGAAGYDAPGRDEAPRASSTWPRA